MAFDLGSALGSDIHQASTESSGNDYALMDCVSAVDSGGFVADPPADSVDYVIAWTFPESGAYVAETSGASAVLGVAPPDCDAQITSCDDECFGDASGLRLEGNAGETVHLIVETFDAGGTFSLSIQPGMAFVCETEPDEGTSTGVVDSGSGELDTGSTSTTG